ncbi:hypothetical protein [Haloarcula salinisoli]|uniref:Uncharacterized protein n=1 Tax=Haloarcula salinisoli TaxID=2487746 RepID=A0A8J7YNH9_9EURY|nr:hypothetical protein [Halomicroarcula salinisoli]MBX0288616.1 hypothetical protein [Halomicroarcula salinisoli]MBX0306004.1 hypothetical protein [Halomicroarcula salinisoli]
MSNAESRPCEFCGTEAMSNTVLTSEPTIRYLDGPPMASVTDVVLCYDCAQDVTDYLEVRTSDSEETVEGPAPFGEADAQAVLERLQANDQLVLETGRESGYGVRAVDGDWNHAVFRAPGPATVETLARDDVREMIVGAKRLALKQFDPAAWRRFEHDP